MTTNIERYYENMTLPNLKMQLDHLESEWCEATDQWKLYCGYYKNGFNKLPEWEQDKARHNCDNRRQFWFLQKEIAFQNYNDFSELLERRDFWTQWNEMKELKK